MRPDRLLAEQLTEHHGLPQVGQLMRELNAVRKSEAYGEPTVSIEWSSEDVSLAVEEYVAAVGDLVRGEG